MHCVADELGQLVMGGLTVTLCYNLVRIWVSGLEFSKTFCKCQSDCSNGTNSKSLPSHQWNFLRSFNTNFFHERTVFVMKLKFISNHRIMFRHFIYTVLTSFRVP